MGIVAIGNSVDLSQRCDESALDGNEYGGIGKRQRNRADGSACCGRCGYDALRHRSLTLQLEGCDVFLGGFHAFREDGIGGIDEFHDSLRRRKGRVVERVGLGHDGNNRFKVLRIALLLGECVQGWNRIS